MCIKSERDSSNIHYLISGQPDKTKIYGDIDGDFVLDRIPPYSLIDNVINITQPPPHPFHGWHISVNDADYRYKLVPVGSRWNQLILYILLWIVPILTGIVAIWVFMKTFYGVKLNEVGITPKKPMLGAIFRPVKRKKKPTHQQNAPEPHSKPTLQSERRASHAFQKTRQFSQVASPKRLTVLIATMEYEIEDWAIKVKIGGLGVMSSLMGKHLKHQDLIWVIPWYVSGCKIASDFRLNLDSIGGITYPVDTVAESIAIKVLGSMYEIKTQYHIVENITYVLLDAPIFRQQTKADPYPTRMDDLDSAVYYSAWNSCIAEAMRRFPVDLCESPRRSIGI